MKFNADFFLQLSSGGIFGGYVTSGKSHTPARNRTRSVLTDTWLKENDDALIEMIPESFRSRSLPGLGRAFCSADQSDDWQAFIKSHAERLPGYERTLAQATEMVHLCAALREARAADLIEAFENPV